MPDLLLSLDDNDGCKSTKGCNLQTSLTRATTNLSSEDAGALALAEANESAEIEITPLKTNKFTLELSALKRSHPEADSHSHTKLVMSNEHIANKRKENKSNTQRKVITVKATLKGSTESRRTLQVFRKGQH